MESPQEDVRPCVQGCGFYGSAQTGYMCSKCFKDAAGATRASIESAPAPAPAPTKPPALSSSSTTAAGPSVLPTLAREPSIGDSSATSASASVAGVGQEQTASAAVAEEEEGKAMAVATEEDATDGAAAGKQEEVLTAAAAATPPVQKKRNRCATCNKKVGLTGIECRCELVFCGLHRYPEAHDCSFDFKAHDRENLKKVLTGGGEFSKVERL